MIGRTIAPARVAEEETRLPRLSLGLPSIPWFASFLGSCSRADPSSAPGPHGPAPSRVLPRDLPCHSPSIIATPSRAGAALELRRPLGQPLDERDHFLHPLSQLRLGLLRALSEGSLERVLQVRDGDPEHLEQTARAVLSHGSLPLLLKVLGRAHGQP